MVPDSQGVVIDAGYNFGNRDAFYFGPGEPYAGSACAAEKVYYNKLRVFFHFFIIRF